VCHVERDGLQRLVAGAGVVQQAPHDTIDALQLAGQAHDHLGVRPAAAQHLDVGPQRAEGVADLVRHAGGQATDAGELLRADELALGVEQVVRHAVQPLGEHREIPRLGVGRALAEVAGGNRVDDRHQPAHGTQHVPCDEVAPEDDEHPDIESDDHQNERDCLPRGEVGGESLQHDEAAHPKQQGGAGEERQVEQQFGAERGLAGHAGWK
jgi:hypothetical protein